jgi:hypothetical protein
MESSVPDPVPRQGTILPGGSRGDDLEKFGGRFAVSAEKVENYSVRCFPASAAKAGCVLDEAVSLAPTFATDLAHAPIRPGEPYVPTKDARTAICRTFAR